MHVFVCAYDEGHNLNYICVCVCVCVCSVVWLEQG